MDNPIPSPQDAAPAGGFNTAITENAAATGDIGSAPSAAFWIRSGAYMIDGLVIFAASAIVTFLLPEPISFLVRLAIAFFYFSWLPVSHSGQTWGKMAGGVAVIRADGSELTRGRMFLRWLCYVPSTIPVGLGFICAGFTENKRALHDFIVGTRVVQVEELSGGRKVLIILAGVALPLIIVLGIAAAIAIPNLSRMQNSGNENAALTQTAPPTIPAAESAPRP